MFIHLDDSLLVEETDPRYGHVVRAVRNLAVAAFESKHILYGDYRIVVAMRKHFHYDHDVWAVFNQIYQAYSVMSCPKEITYYLRVVIEAGEDGVDENGKRYGQVAYTAFEDSKSTQECNLISEDFNDCKFYNHVLEHYKKWNSIKIPCRFNKVSGAGDRTVDNVVNCVYTNKQVTVCIVDTDKKYPEQELSVKSTCHKCQKVGKAIPTYKFVALDVQEIENLVPFNVTDHFTWNEDNRENKQAFDGLRNNAHSEYVLPYFDIKNGIVNDELLRIDASYRNYAMKCYYLHPTLSQHGDFDAYVRTLADKAVVYPHLLKGLLKAYLEFLDNGQKFDVELMEYQQMEWDKIGNAMLNMGCTRNKEAIL